MHKSPFFLFTLLAYSLALHTLFAESSCDAQGNEVCMAESRVHRLSISHREGGGIGYNQGYTSLDAFFSLPSKWDMVSFFDFRAHVFNDGKWAANAGLGIRKLLSNSSWILGGNAFYDYRHATHTTFNQVGFGLELLGTKWDFHGNAYIPVGHNRRNYANPFRRFEGHSAFFTRKYEFAFAGADVLAGRELWSCDDYLIRGALGAYFLKGHFNKKAGGGLVKVTAEITRYVHLEGQLSYDNIFKWRPQGELRINIPIGKKIKLNRCNLSCNSQEILSRALVSPVERFEIIAKKNRKKKTIALDPVSGQPLNFIFVDNLRGHSDGSFENPFATLFEAQNGSQPNNVIYVFPGDGTTNGMNMGITLQQGQYFIGSSVAFPVSIKGAGLVAIPPQSSIFPSITNSGNTITLDNGNTISGFAISSGSSGVMGGEVSVFDGATITNNQFSNVGAQVIELENATGNIIISNNQNSVITGILIQPNATGSSNIFIANNNLILPTTSGEPIAIIVFGTHQSTITIENNVISGGDIGIHCSYSTSNIVNTLISNNNLNNLGTFGIEVSSGSTMQNNTTFGIEVSSGSSILNNTTIVRNTITQTGEAGVNGLILLNKPMNFDITGNTLTQTNTSGGSNSGGIVIQNNDQISLRLISNSSIPASGFGYFLNSNGVSFTLQSPDLTLAGVQSINIGTLDAVQTEPITFIPLTGP